ncbi:NADP-dependent oxidoreductase [Microbacterium sp. W1N]|uniref:quinone oxidoreductase family protein n=1 Tax=Microbacterium festucae TaxID=2977531 RepID=UPI0021BE9CB7|nr:NADP-dependent oxidoreductase [Microbacterium festucae]MCT9820639.1 NADP-dependent oxidoreductase [Microbacterium festucae]
MTIAITHTAFGGPEVLTPTEVALPPLGATDVAVRIEAAGVNPVDHKLRSGQRASDPITTPRHVGNDGAGVVTAVGPDVTGFRVGDRVVITGALGTYASELVVSQEALFPRPPQVSAAEGAALGIPIGTAYQTVRSLAVGPEDTVLVHAGSGAVGQAVIQFAVLAGARVLATTSDRRADRVRALGAEPVSYAPGIADRVRAAAPDGVTVAIDLAGTDEALDSSVELVADRRRIATLVRGADADALGIQAFRGGSPRPLTAREEAWRRESIPVALHLLAVGAFSVELGPALPLAEAAEAHRVVEAGVDGKVVLVP